MTDATSKLAGDPTDKGDTPRDGGSEPILKQLGPGLITGAADDDPSGIATYSQAGAQFGFNMLWLMLLTYPLMSAIQMISGRIGRVTGCGLAANLHHLATLNSAALGRSAVPRQHDQYRRQPFRDGRIG